MTEFAGAAEHVQELRLVVTTDDYAAALTFYRDVVGMPELAAYEAEGGHVTILDAGRATLEIADPVHAAYIDRVEVGRRAGRTGWTWGLPDPAADRPQQMVHNPGPGEGTNWDPAALHRRNS